MLTENFSLLFDLMNKIVQISVNEKVKTFRNACTVTDQMMCKTHNAD